MHELSVAVALVEQVEEVIRKEGGSRALSVSVSVGALSGVNREALELAFPVACESTSVAGARLEITAVAARVKCGTCSEETSPEFPFFACEKCGSTEVEVIAGRELLLMAVEIDGG